MPWQLLSVTEYFLAFVTFCFFFEYKMGALNVFGKIILPQKSLVTVLTFDVTPTMELRLMLFKSLLTIKSLNTNCTMFWSFDYGYLVHSGQLDRICLKNFKRAQHWNTTWKNFSANEFPRVLRLATRNQLISVFIYIFVQSSFHKKNWKKNSETKVYLFELALPLFEKENRLHPRAHCLDERKLLASSSGCLKVFFLF